MTPKKNQLLGMLNDYMQERDRGQTHEDSIAKITLENAMREKRESRALFPNTIALTSLSESYISDFKRDLSRLRKTEKSIPTFTKKDISVQDIKTLLDASPTVFELSKKEKSFMPSLLELSEKLQNNFNAHSLLLYFSKDARSRDAAKQHFSLTVSRDSIANLKFDTKLQSSYYNPNSDIKNVLSIFKDLNDGKLIPKHIVRVLGVYDDELGTQVFSNNPEDHNPYTITKAYDELIDYYKSNYGIKLKDSEELMKEKINKVGIFYRTNSVLDAGSEEKTLDVYTQALVKSTAVLNELSGALDAHGIIMENSSLHDDFSKLNYELTSLQRIVSHKISQLSEDIKSLWENLDLPMILRDIVQLKEYNMELMLESIERGELLESKSNIFINTSTSSDLESHRDNYSAAIDGLNKDILDLQGESEEVIKEVLSSFPAKINNLEKIEERINTTIANAAYANDLVGRRIEKDTLVKSQIRL